MLYGKFGKSIVEKFLKPYNEKLYAVDLSKLDVDAMGRFFPYADKEAIIRNFKEFNNTSYNDTFLYPVNGADTIVKILFNKLDKDKIYLNESVVEVNLKDKYVVTSSNEKIYFDRLINTIPLNNFLPLIKEDKLANELSYNKVLVFNLGFDKKSKYKDLHWLYVPSNDINFYRVGFYDNILNSDKLSLYVEIGFSKKTVITKEIINEQLDLTLKNLEKMDIVTSDMKLVDYETVLMDPAYVHISKNTDNKIRKLLTDLKRDDVFSIGRYGAWYYCSMEDNMLEAKKLSDDLLGKN